MGIDIAPERAPETGAIRAVVAAAFVHDPKVPDLVELIRASPGYAPDLALVARRETEVVGHVMLSRAQVHEDDVRRHDVLVLSPLAVAPPVQGQGVGSALVRDALRRADVLGAPVVLLQGSPRYYPRFGFRDSRTLGITMDLPDWAPREAGQACPLSRYDTRIRGHLVDPEPFRVLS